jgi:hypothetical protein
VLIKYPDGVWRNVVDGRLASKRIEWDEDWCARELHRIQRRLGPKARLALRLARLRRKREGARTRNAELVF